MTEAAAAAQVEAILHLMREARLMGWSKLEAHYTPGGTLRVVAEDAPVVKGGKSTFTTGLGK